VRVKIFSFWIRMLDFLFGTKLHYHFAVNVLSIIDHYLFWYTILVDQVLFYQPFHHLLCYMSIWFGFYLFCEVVDSHEDESMPIAGFQANRPNYINSSHCKWPCRCLIKQRSWRCIDLITIHLTLMTFPDIVDAVFL
jgi:hypothetical protein